jgi:hypothetical protein
VETFVTDRLYLRIARAVKEILAVGAVVAPVDVLIRMGLLARADLEAWRFGRIPYLEQVIDCNLTRVGRLLRILRFHAHDLRLVRSITGYVRHGKGPKRPLRFSKTGDLGVEKAYARHFVWPEKSAFPLDRLEADGRPKARTAWPPVEASGDRPVILL